MSKDIIEKFSQSKYLLLAVGLLIFVLVVQLYAITLTVNAENFISFFKDNAIGATLAVSYFMVSVSLLFVLIEFFNIKRRIRGLIALRNLTPTGPITISKPLVLSVEDDIDASYEEIHVQEEHEETPEADTSGSDEGLDLIAAALSSDDHDNAEDENGGYQKIEITLPKSPSYEPEEEEPKEEPVDKLVKEEPFKVSTGKKEEVHEIEIPNWYDQSEILQTLEEMKNVVTELKERKAQKLQQL